MFRDEPVHEVARRLNICAQGLASHDLLARSRITEARKRLGANPVEWLFRQTGSQWGRERYDAQGVDLPGGLGAIAGLQHHPP
ncbi:transposase, IS4 [Stutzerimonas stutzeri NF13]|uniref:Transposase, IS4 n=1 Tax=Stutzerimonas stutzeri NF13 TaxID=1212548 RepID=M2VGH0_STUST|nr:transposase, IS4 [Stutzerimonas stutzeri NF13]